MKLTGRIRVYVLPTLSAFLRQNVKKAIWIKLRHSLGTLPYFQALLNLQQEASSKHNFDPTVLTGEACNEENLIASSKERGLFKMTRRIFFCKFWISYLFRRYDKAAVAGENTISFRAKKVPHPSLEYVLETFYLSLLGFVLVRNGMDEDGKWRDVATQCCASVLTWAKEDSKWNFQHKSDLLLAEQAYTSGNLDEAVARYTRSIEAAGTHGFINEQALACERAGLFYLDQGHMAEAKRHLKMAEFYYGTWGARRKVSDMQELLEKVG